MEILQILQPIFLGIILAIIGFLVIVTIDFLKNREVFNAFLIIILIAAIFHFVINHS